MASIVASQLRDIKPTLPVSPASSGTMSQPNDARARSPRGSRPVTLLPPGTHSDDENESNGSGGELDMPADSGAKTSSDSPGPSRKRRRSRKGSDKRFACEEAGCGKSYSRAEHLYRHQLNHSSKNTFQCQFPDCPRTFVRGDLLKRHHDRHLQKGSQLNRRDSMVSQGGAGSHGANSPDMSRHTIESASSRPTPTPMQFQPVQDAATSPYSPISATHPMGFPNGAPSAVTDGYPHDAPYGPGAAHVSNPQQPILGQTRPNVQAGVQGNVTPYGVMSPVQHAPQPFGPTSRAPQSGADFVSHQQVMPFNLPPSQYPGAQTPASRDHGQQTYSTDAGFHSPHTQPSELVMLDHMAMHSNVPMLGGTDRKSPYVGMPEDFMAFLFNSSPDGTRSPVNHAMAATLGHYGDLNSQYALPFYGADGVSAGYFPQGTAAPQHVMAVNNLLDQNVPEAFISDEKSQEIFDFIKERFNENHHAPLERQRDSILDGDPTDENHMLSKRMMQAYIGSYWYHFSDQIPILHKPTFSPDKTPTLLLLAMMTIGAALLDRTHGPKVTTAGAKLSNFLAWHLRWEAFMDSSFRPPAKLWVFQTLILLELYEKMYSTRELHERAHIHHATTITLMRRGRSLIGKPTIDSPPNMRESTNGSRHSSTSGIANTPEDWWNQWITNEATRRAAFAAFVVDSNHATMFGHSAVMVAQEMRLPLPCDESLWRATSSAEVGRIEAGLLAQGIKPLSFLEGLKRTLSNQEVRTNSFGRTVLMAGLLSVTWHMHQRDLQVNVLGGGVVQALGGRDKWRATLTRAYDSWKADFDNALERNENSSDPYRFDGLKEADFNIVFESRTVLHHLAHMAMHADIVDVQMFARAKRLLGRAIGRQEFGNAQRRIKDMWAPSARARDATYYALKFLASVLVPDEMGALRARLYRQDHPYEARDDVLLNRPWVLYFAALVVWCYGFALEGPCTGEGAPPTPSNEEEKLQQMKEYLTRYGRVRDPNELRSMTGINQNTALLMVLKGGFENTRWELLHEGSTLLSNCILLNSGGTIS